MRKLLVSLFTGALILGVGAQPASAHEGGGGRERAKRAYEFLGVVTAVTADDDPATPDTMSFSVLRANSAGRRWASAHPGDVVVSLTRRTRFGGEYDGLGETAGDYRVGDGVRVSARRTIVSTPPPTADRARGRGRKGKRTVTYADSLDAARVRLVLQSYSGTVASYDGDLGTVSMDVFETNAVAQAWLDANGSPNPLDADTTEDSCVWRDGDGDPQAGDSAEMYARPADDGDGLEVVLLHATPPDGGGGEGDGGGESDGGGGVTAD
jgi:hypothetical protein